MRCERTGSTNTSIRFGISARRAGKSCKRFDAAHGGAPKGLGAVHEKVCPCLPHPVGPARASAGVGAGGAFDRRRDRAKALVSGGGGESARDPWRERFARVHRELGGRLSRASSRFRRLAFCRYPARGG